MKAITLCLAALAAALLLFACAEEPPPRPVVGVVVDTVRLEPYQPQSVHYPRHGQWLAVVARVYRG